MPVTAEVGGLALLLHHFEDEREAVDTGDEGIGAGRAEPGTHLHDVGRLKLLVADHQHRVAQERLVHLAPAGIGQACQVDVADFGAERAGERLDPHRARSYRGMAKRIAVVGAGALGGYVGGSLAQLGHDVTLIDAWPENVETIRARGLELDGMTPEERFTVKNLRILHVTEAQSLAKTPFDVAMVSMKSYDTLWATA